jgi:hypothetical protein
MAPVNHDEHVEACTRIFPTWSWIAAILAGSALTIGALAWAGSAKFTITDMNISVLQKDVNDLQKMDSKLDTIVELVRHR